MALLIVLLLVAAVVLAVLRGFGIPTRRVDLGWLAIACVIAALAAIPAIVRAGGS
jgi:hypothetical protein